MPDYLLQTELWKIFWPTPVTVLLISWTLWRCGMRSGERKGTFVVIISFASLGLVTGLLAGFSRAPVVGAVLPAVLSLVAGVAVYLLGAETPNRSLVSLSIVALSTNLFIGATWGAVLRENAEEYKNRVEVRQTEAWMESEVRSYRRYLGLPDYPPPEWRGSPVPQ